MRPAYKATNSGAVAPFSGFAWPKPSGKRPGKWVKVKGPLVMCKSGLHLCADTTQLLDFLYEEIWVAEWRGEMSADTSKIAVTEARLIRKTAWDRTARSIFAADCAARALDNFERLCPNDERPRRAIQAARDFAAGKIDAAAARSAADLAYSAARSAARSAADSARSAAYSAYSAERQRQAGRLLGIVGGPA